MMKEIRVETWPLPPTPATQGIQRFGYRILPDDERAAAGPAEVPPDATTDARAQSERAVASTQEEGNMPKP